MTFWRMLVFIGSLAAASVQAGPLLDRWLEHHTLPTPTAAAPAPHGRGLDDDDGPEAAPFTALPAGVQVLRDVAYGDQPAQRMDVYRPRQRLTGAPVIFMVHGGGWRWGDKAARAVVEHKVAHWVPQGYLVVSVNYRLLPGVKPPVQAQVQDVARALAVAQAHAASWGGNAGQFILMGHSSGAHLVALLSADPQLARKQGAQAWLGTVLLDSAALDVPALMQNRHLHLYDTAFGDEPAQWRAASPLHQLEAVNGPLLPMLAVCSTRRSDSCAQAEAFAARAEYFGRPVTVLSEDATHRDINLHLGQPGPYTRAVDAFITSLRPSSR